MKKVVWSFMKRLYARIDKRWVEVQEQSRAEEFSLLKEVWGQEEVVKESVSPSPTPWQQFVEDNRVVNSYLGRTA
jgi:hypothetical protein